MFKCAMARKEKCEMGESKRIKIEERNASIENGERQMNIGETKVLDIERR